MPQLVDAERNGWPGEYTGRGMEATRRFFGVVDDAWSVSGFQGRDMACASLVSLQ